MDSLLGIISFLKKYLCCCCCGDDDEQTDDDQIYIKTTMLCCVRVHDLDLGDDTNLPKIVHDETKEDEKKE